MTRYAYSSPGIIRCIISVAFISFGCYQKITAQQPDKTETPEKKIITLDISRLPEIPNLSSFDDLFVQYSDDVEENYMSAAAGKPVYASFYTYTVRKGETLFTIAARCSIPYETLATLNAIPNIATPLESRKLLLPTVAGVFVFEKPQSSIEILVSKKNALLLEQKPNIWYTIHTRKCCFLLNERFSSTERAFFLDSSLRMPLDHYWLSSAYGMRVSPISGNWKFHKGIDMAAPDGTPVYACKGGKAIICKKGDPVYGNYIILQHDEGMTSVYAHLSKIMITAGDTVYTGTQIGLVGHTGAATGPHLHFEIRINGIATDPQKLLSE
jgi:murein DD-endopeptidase MepM/ murein hydrolase activator NlpD